MRQCSPKGTIQHISPDNGRLVLFDDIIVTTEGGWELLLLLFQQRVICGLLWFCDIWSTFLPDLIREIFIRILGFYEFKMGVQYLWPTQTCTCFKSFLDDTLNTIKTLKDSCCLKHWHLYSRATPAAVLSQAHSVGQIPENISVSLLLSQNQTSSALSSPPRWN